MKFVAFYKVFSGHEFLEASIMSIFHHVERIVISTSDKSWAGVGENTCRPIAERLAEKYDKIEVLYSREVDQKKQCDQGMRYCAKTYKYDYTLLIDSDEIWTDETFKEAIKYLNKVPRKPAYRCNMYTYVKDIHYRVDPIEPLQPVVFVRHDIDYFGEDARCCGIPYFERMRDVYIHHFPYVRDSFTDILIKLINSHTSEGQEHEPLDKWIAEKWCKLPAGQDFHPAIPYQANWKKIRIIEDNELPEALRGTYTRNRT